MAERTDNRSIGDLFSELSRETSQLVKKEVELATTEMTAKARKAGGHVGVAAAGGALAHAGLLVFLAALVLALSDMGVTPWLSALIISLLTIIGAWIFEWAGYAPCPLCLMQRWAYYATIPLSAAVAVAAGRSRNLAQGGLLVIAAIMIAVDFHGLGTA